MTTPTPEEVMARTFTGRHCANGDAALRSCDPGSCRCRGMAKAALAALAEAGYALVPVEPTEAMKDAGSPYMGEFAPRGRMYAEACYCAMVTAAASPAPDDGWVEPGEYVREGEKLEPPL